MKVLILGGTGPMGVYLTELLRKRASEVVVTSRTAREAEENLRFLKGNAKDFTFLKPLLAQGWDAIIDFMVYSTTEFRNRIDSFLAATGQYVYLSSARVYAGSDEALTEASPRLLDVSTDKKYLATDEYALAKARQEDCLFGHTKKNWTIIRPYITYGPQRLQLGVLEKEAWLYRALQGRSIIFNEDIAKCTTTMTHGQDVARGMAALVGQESALGEVFHITGPHSESWQSILECYLARLAQEMGDVSVKNVDLPTFHRCHGGRYQMIYDRVYNRTFENSKINSFLDTNTFIPIETGLNRCISQFLNSPKFSAINWATEAKKDRAANEFVKVGEIKSPALWLRYLKHRFGL